MFYNFWTGKRQGYCHSFWVWAISRFIFSGVKVQGGVSGNWNLDIFSGCNWRFLTASWYRILNVAIELGFVSKRPQYLGSKIILCTGFSGHAATLDIYWSASLSLLITSGSSSASTARLSAGDVRRAPMHNLRSWFWIGSSILKTSLCSKCEWSRYVTIVT